LLLLSGGAVHAGGDTPAGDWPQWRGPHRDGQVERFTPPDPWPEKPRLVWQVDVGEGHSNPVVAGGAIFLHAREGDEEVVRRMDPATGKTLWRTTHKLSYTMHPAATGHGKGPKSTPVHHEGRLYTLSITGVLSCLEAESGKLIWRKDSSQRFKGKTPLYGTATSPMVDGDRLIAFLGGNDSGALVAMDGQTGDEIWSWTGDGPGYASPILVELKGVRQVVTQSQERLVAVDAGTGALLWSMKFETPYVQNIVTPLVVDDLIVFSGLERGVLALRPVLKGGKWEPETVWHNLGLSMYMNSPVLAGDRICGLSPDSKGQFFCMAVDDGRLLWASEGRVGQQAATVVSGGLLFHLTDAAELVVVPAGGSTFAPVARYTMAETPTWSHPVFMENDLLIKDKLSLARWSFTAGGMRDELEVPPPVGVRRGEAESLSP
jgi:outer membrane protein assembly factor BamB